MKLGRVLVFVCATALGRVATSANAESPALPLTPIADLPLPGNATRFDYQWIDAAARRLYIAHLGDGSLLVFDLDAQRVVEEIRGLPSVHGVVAVPSEHVVLATATAEKTLVVIDDRTFQIKARVPAGEYPNGLAFDAKSSRAFVSNNSGHGIAVVDIDAEKPLPSIDIGGGAGNSQYDATTGHVLVAIHGAPALVEIDPEKTRIATHIPLHDVSTCHGLLVSPSFGLAFAVCHGAGPTLVVVDLASRNQTRELPLPSGVDVLAFDPGLGRLYAASETGTVAVFRVSTDGGVAEIAHAFLAPNAHSVAVDPTTHRVYFPLASVDGKPVLRVMRPL